MSGVLPKFRVFAIKDGMTSGLLIERQMSRDAPVEKKYFWLSSAEGLAPTTEILNACKGVHELVEGQCNSRFMDLLVRFTTFVDQRGKLQVAMNALGKYLRGEKYQRIIDHFFERGDVTLREFFINARLFKDAVITKVASQEQLFGKAEEFRILSPHDIVGTGHYLKSIAHVLKVGSSESRWFRREGPLAVDFDCGMVFYRHKTLNEIKKMLTSNHFSLLVGEPASGKTVLVRQAGYDLFKQEKKVVYYFDGALERGFDKYQLIREINGLRGIFIIENIHLETPKYQRVLYSINPNENRHVLFTARPSFEHTEHKKDRKFSELEHVKVDSFEVVDQIIGYFASHHPKLDWTDHMG
ncbi:hypothetical protein ACFL3Q_02480, partial [Planctomycetota bacterium]